MRSPDELTAAGYLKHKPSDILHSHAIALYQKRILDSNRATRYFINVYEYTPLHVDPDMAMRYRFSIEAQLYRSDPLCSTMDLHLHHETDMTPIDIENFYERVYSALICCLDPHN